MSDGVGRRSFLAGAGVMTGAMFADVAPAATQDTPALPASADAAPKSPSRPTAMLALNETEAAFLTAAVDVLIPHDSLSPSASQAGVVTFIDRQLAGAYGAGAGLYRSGPFQQGAPEQGYQLALTPRGFFSAGIAAVNAWCIKSFGHTLDQLSVADRTKALTQLEKGEAKLEDFSSTRFFEALLQITMEGFFADPIYGGNREMAGWKMLGFPGLPAFYAGTVATTGSKRIDTPPKSIEDFL